MYYIAENLELRHDEMAQRISAMTGKAIKDAKSEVDLAIQRLFHWGAYADKYGGTIQVQSNSVKDFGLWLCKACLLLIGNNIVWLYR